MISKGHKHAWRFWLLVFVLVIAGLTLLWIPETLLSTWMSEATSSHVITFLRSLGEALAIAGFLAGTVDVYIKRDLAREVAVDVAAAVAGSEMPDEVRWAIKEGFAPDLLLIYNQKHHYKIEHEPNSAFVRVTTTIEYEARNFGRDIRKYRPSMALEETDSPEFLILSVDGMTYQGGELQKLVARQIRETPEGLGIMVATGPLRSIPGKGPDALPSVVRVKWKATQRKEARSSDTIFLGNHINAEIEADVPADFKFLMESTERDGEARTATFNSWRYKRLFRNDLLRVWWWPIEKQGESQP